MTNKYILIITGVVILSLLLFIPGSPLSIWDDQEMFEYNDTGTLSYYQWFDDGYRWGQILTPGLTGPEVEHQLTSIQFLLSGKGVYPDNPRGEIVVELYEYPVDGVFPTDPLETSEIFNTNNLPQIAHEWVKFKFSGDTTITPGTRYLALLRPIGNTVARCFIYKEGTGYSEGAVVWNFHGKEGIGTVQGYSIRFKEFGTTDVEIPEPTLVSCYNCQGDEMVVEEYEECPDGWYELSEIPEGYCDYVPIPELDEETDIPGFELIVLLCAIGIAFILLKKKRI